MSMLSALWPGDPCFGSSRVHLMRICSACAKVLVRRLGVTWGRRTVGMTGAGLSTLAMTAAILTSDQFLTLLFLAISYLGVAVIQPTGLISDMGGEDLDGDGPLQPGVGGLVDLAHATRADGGLDLIRAEVSAALQGHCGCWCHGGELYRGDSSVTIPVSGRAMPG